METFSALLALSAGKSPATGRLSKKIVKLEFWDAIALIMT